MRNIAYKKYAWLCAALLFSASLPVFFVESMRDGMMALVATFARGLHLAKLNVSDCHLKQLEGENLLLRMEIGKLCALLEHKDKPEETMYHAIAERSPSLYQKMGYLASLEKISIPAQVIYRDPGSWSSSLWINAGEETNRVLKQNVIQKNSPVILGRALIGAIDYVGKKQSRMRLITDFALKPSVRAIRGLEQNLPLLGNIETILRYLNLKKDLPLTDQERTSLFSLLRQLKDMLQDEKEEWHLAKGILQGSGTPLWRRMSHTLKGIGFNYDFADVEGPARELSTGKPISGDGIAIPILKLNDLLVTTGLDGVFPAGLRVAYVTKIFPLKEGSYTYEIEATSVVGNLDCLQTVFVIPPVGYEADKHIGES
jgi:rod shape-determining protein MreC